MEQVSVSRIGLGRDAGGAVYMMAAEPSRGQLAQADPIAPANARGFYVPNQDDRNLPFYLTIALMTMVVPLSFEIGTLFMTGSRALLLVITPMLLIGLLRGKYGKISRVDIMFALFICWFSLANLVQAPSRFVTFVGSNFVIIVGAYLMGRCGIRGPRAFRQLIYLYGTLVLLSLPFALYEMETSKMLIARWLEHIPGIATSADVNYPSRNELERVQFTFVHPIHYGLFCCYIFAMVAVGLRDSLPFVLRWTWALLIGLCCFTSGSSGPFTGILIAVVLILYGFLAGGRWKLLMWSSAVFYAILEALSNRPAYFVIIEKMAFNPGTAYGRRIILEAGLLQVTRTPVFGTPYSLPLPPWMTGSLDNYWLLLAVAYGIPAFVFLFGAYVYALIRASKYDLSAEPRLAALRKGWVIGLIGSMFALATVAIWSELMSLTFLIFGSGQWLMNIRPVPAGKASGTPPVADDTARPFTRFPARTRVGLYTA